jgi:hypothetical protein
MPGQRNRRYLIVNEGANPETGGRILCAWEDCPRYAVDLYKVKVNHGRTATPYIVRYAFCSERHQAYWVHSHRDNGNLPPGLSSLAPPT